MQRRSWATTPTSPTVRRWRSAWWQRCGLSALLGNEDLTAPLIDILKHIGLPTELNYDREAIFNALLSDKKKFGATVNFILVREAGRAEITPIDAEKLHEYVLKL